MKAFLKNLLLKIKYFFTVVFRHGEKLNLEYPICWENMSAEDFRNVCLILSQPHGRKETLFLCLCALAHIRPENPSLFDPEHIEDMCVFYIGGRHFAITPSDITEACGQLEYILDSVGLAPCPFKGVDRKLYGISFRQFFEADAFMLRYQAEDHNGKWLIEFLKTITGGAVRKPLPWQKIGAVIWWNGVKKYLKEKYPFVFQDGGDGAAFGDRTMADILQELLSAMNDNKPQNNDDILKSDVHSVLFCLNKIYGKDADR